MKPTPEQVEAARRWAKDFESSDADIEVLRKYKPSAGAWSNARTILLLALEAAEQEIEDLTYEIKEANERE